MIPPYVSRCNDRAILAWSSLRVKHCLLPSSMLLCVQWQWQCLLPLSLVAHDRQIISHQQIHPYSKFGLSSCLNVRYSDFSYSSCPSKSSLHMLVQRHWSRVRHREPRQLGQRWKWCSVEHNTPGRWGGGVKRIRSWDLFHRNTEHRDHMYRDRFPNLHPTRITLSKIY